MNNLKSGFMVFKIIFFDLFIFYENAIGLTEKNIFVLPLNYLFN